MPLVDAGSRLFAVGRATASFSFTPQNDRAAIVRAIKIKAVSASDIWTLTVNNKEICRFAIRTGDDQSLLSTDSNPSFIGNDLFDIYQEIAGEYLAFPVPQANTMVIASVGGATAQIAIEYSEHTPAELNPALMNHPQGSRFVIPVYGFASVHPTAAGELLLDSQIAPYGFVDIFTGNPMQAGAVAGVLALFLQGGGVNTFSGGADHRSATSYMKVSKNNDLLFTRTLTDGIPLVGTAAAAGSANTVRTDVLNGYPQFARSQPYEYNDENFPVHVRPGDRLAWRLGLTGDFTGGPDYSTHRMLALVDVRYGV